MLYLDKILTQLAYPIFCSLCIIGLAVIIPWGSWRRYFKLLIFLAFAWLWLWSSPVFSDFICRSLESQYSNTSFDKLPQAEAIVVLGGGLSTGPPSWPYPDLGSAADRLWHAARIYKAKKANLILVSGQSMPWKGDRSSVSKGSQRLLMDLGVEKKDILLETKSLNTWQNACYSAQVLQNHGLERIILVTSAMHMPRAMSCFKTVGLETIPAATDFEIKPEPNHILRWLPDAESLHDSSRALKEYLGILVYWWRYFRQETKSYVRCSKNC